MPYLTYWQLGAINVCGIMIFMVQVHVEVQVPAAGGGADVAAQAVANMFFVLVTAMLNVFSAVSSKAEVAMSCQVQACSGAGNIDIPSRIKVALLLEITPRPSEPLFPTSTVPAGKTSVPTVVAMS